MSIGKEKEGGGTFQTNGKWHKISKMEDKGEEKRREGAVVKQRVNGFPLCKSLGERQ